MKFSIRRTLVILSVVFPFIFPKLASAQYHFESTPGLSVREVYDDNIYLDSTEEKSDYITGVSPSLSLRFLSQKSTLDFRYAPTFVWYGRYSENDTIRHSGTLKFARGLTQHLRFDLSDTYLKSEEPIEESETIQGVRRTRNTYQRNRGEAGFQYLLGPENAIIFGYRHSLLMNKDPSVDDGTIQNPFGGITHWFSIRNGLELDYDFTSAIFTRDNGSRPEDDYAGHGTGLRYIHRFSPHTRGFISYHFTDRDFDGSTEDYRIHEGSIGLDKFFSSHSSVSVEGGSFTQDKKRSSNQSGYKYNISLVRRFARGSLDLGGQGGWNESYLEAENRGFSRYWSAKANFLYQILASLNSYGGTSYRHDRDDTGRVWETVNENCGLKWICLSWLSFSLEYSYSKRDDDVDTEDYTVNRVMLVLTANKLYRW